MVEEIVIDKSKKRQKPTATQKTKQNTYQVDYNMLANTIITFIHYFK